ncbi:septum formation initiator family protein [Halovulum dunhuangense]|uniref:Septum formation initiator family protein n=1 Tax=Halovulum dunhuangense TaxID=1505036 RepID=A0A849L707_9RHOB|nr:septum formation initiator family protein [Halovulum dunhuangense]NNU81922.1 septum formation initiator family protein [Halovulum dunhuangense]
MVFSIGVTAAITYFTYAAIQGDYGTFRRIQVEAQAIQLERELETLRAERAVLENRTRRLSAEYLDLDLLDEQARKVLGLARADEIVIR